MSRDRELNILRCALADLEGILPEYDPDRLHVAWDTADDLRELIADIERNG